MPYFYIIMLVCGIDQALKFWVQTNLIPFQSIELCQGWLSITYVSNYGAAFGILHSQTALLLGVALGTFVYVWIHRREMERYPKLFQIGIVISLGGALGNFIDRLRQGFVTDYLDLHFWPVFNFADIAIVGGVGLIVAGMFYQQMQQRRHETSAQDSKEEKL